MTDNISINQGQIAVFPENLIKYRRVINNENLLEQLSLQNQH